MLRKIGLICAATVLTLAVSTLTFAQEATDLPEGTEMAAPTTGYASVNGLEMYYEIHGAGEPLVVLHGAYMSTGAMGEVVSRFAETRQVIAVDLQAHGRTNDVADRPITYEQMADDVAALLGEIGIAKADVFGYSMGGGVTLQLAIRHPEVVNKIVVASATFNSNGFYPGFMEMVESITPEMMIGYGMDTEYRQSAPNPDNFPVLVEKLKTLDLAVQDWSAESIQGITAPTLVIQGDSDAITPEHGVEMFRLRGGGMNGDITGLPPNARLAILPGTTHTSVIVRLDWIVPMVNEFLDGTVVSGF